MKYWITCHVSSLFQCGILTQTFFVFITLTFLKGIVCSYYYYYYYYCNVPHFSFIWCFLTIRFKLWIPSYNSASVIVCLSEDISSKSTWGIAVPRVNFDHLGKMLYASLLYIYYYFYRNNLWGDTSSYLFIWNSKVTKELYCFATLNDARS